MDIMFHKHSRVISRCFLVFRLIIQYTLGNSYFISVTCCVCTSASLTAIDSSIIYSCQTSVPSPNNIGGLIKLKKTPNVPDSY